MGDDMAKIAICLLLLLIFPVIVSAGIVGIGANGGALVPVAQKDQDVGSVFGIKLRVKLTGPLSLEPNLNFCKFGAVTFEGVGTRDGSTFTSGGVDLVVGAPFAAVGLKPYAFLGGAIYTTKRSGDATTNKAGWSFGVGLAVGIMANLDIDIRGRMNIALSEGNGTKKAVGITGGLTYYFGE
jgi:hypothetical protein